MLRGKARSVYDGREQGAEVIASSSNCHINFFEELEKGEVQVVRSNYNYEKEKKEEKEKYEKQIGYLTYLGQDTNEANGNVSWYNRLPDRSVKNEPELFVENKFKHDPLIKMNNYSGKPNDHLRQDSSRKKIEEKKKSKKHKRKNKRKCITSSSSGSDSTIEISKPTGGVEELRAKRIKRENEERLRGAAVLAKLRGDVLPVSEKPNEPMLKQKYNSQFNPHVAKQNTFE